MEIEDVLCARNGTKENNEAGIWIYGADGVTVSSVTLEENPYGIKVGHSEDVTLDGITIDEPKTNGGTANETAGIKLSIGDDDNLYRQDAGHNQYAGMPLGGLRRIVMDNFTFNNMGSEDYHIVYSGDEEEVYDGLSGHPPTVDVDQDGIDDVIDVDQTGGYDLNLDGIDDSPGCMLYRCKDITFDAAKPAKVLEIDFRVNGTLGYVDEIAEAIVFEE